MQRTAFSSRVEVLVKYGELPFQLKNGSDLPPHSYKVTDKAPGGQSFAGSTEVELVPRTTS